MECAAGRAGGTDGAAERIEAGLRGIAKRLTAEIGRLERRLVTERPEGGAV